MILVRIVNVVKAKLYRFLWKINILFNKKKLIRFYLPEGGIFEYPLNSAIGFALFSNGFEIAERQFVQQSLSSGQVFLDIGANAGIYTVIASKQVGLTGQVFSFEPGVRELELLKSNIALNDLTNVMVCESGISNMIGEAKFGVSKDGALSSLLKTAHPRQDIQGWNTIKTITIDAFAREKALKKVDFIKIDIEGAELLAFQGGQQVIQSWHPLKIMFEASDLNSQAFGYKTSDLLASVKELGFDIYFFDRRGKLTKVEKLEPQFGKRIVNFVAISKSNNLLTV